MRCFAYLVLVVAAATGCGDPAAPDPDPGPGGNGGAGVGGDGGAGGLGGAAGGGGAFVPRCGVSSLCPNCPDEESLCDGDVDCPVGSVCLETGCEGTGDASEALKRCFLIGGGACASDEDCGDPDYVCALEIGRCLRITPGCDDSNDCVAGFACEDDLCVDRRVPCIDASDCPHGYACQSVSVDQRFCRRVARPCLSDLDCQTLGVLCGDADGDGAMECMASTEPTAPDPVSCDNSQCGLDAAPVCELTEQGTRAVCGEFGLCAFAQDCADGFECRDLWGDARSECVLPGGACVDSRDCPTREVCASPRTGDPPLCVGGAAM